jgi:hypothetical protein
MSLLPAVLLLAGAWLPRVGCASRPVSPSTAQADLEAGNRVETSVAQAGHRENLVVHAFYGGGIRAAAGRIVAESPEVQRLRKDPGARLVTTAAKP